MISQKEGTLNTEITNLVKLNKNLIEYRDNQILKGFIYKGFEECSFNDFYSNGNENVLKYAGIINGIKKVDFSLFQDMDEEILYKMNIINETANKIMSNSENNLQVYNTYYKTSKFAVIVSSDGIYKYDKLYNEKAINGLLEELKKLDSIHDKNDQSFYMAYQKVTESIENIRRDININTKMLSNNKNLKRNAYYSIKKIELLIDREGFEKKSDIELKNYFNSKINKEIQKVNSLFDFSILLDLKNDKLLRITT